MPFKPNYRLQRADRQRAKEEKQRKKLARRTERGTPESDALDVPGEEASDAPATTDTESQH